VAVDYFLKIDGVQGESADAKHKNEIQLEAFSWGEAVAAPHLGAAGGAAGHVEMRDFSFTMLVNKASPKLMLACATGKHLKEAVLTARRAGKAQQEFLVIKLSQVLVSSYETAGSAGGISPIDQVSLGYSKIELEYRPQKSDGSLDAPVTAGWDLIHNKAI
jgi:type VI secretion system secreted protein Hcp